jgi:DNA-binding response OmpR family regulator
MAKKLLIVEDDLFIRDIYQETLNDAGFETTVAQNGQEGLTKLLANKYDLVLLDIMMPKLNGIGLLKAAKEKNLLKKNGPVVLLTNLAHDPVIQEGLALGAKDFLIKTDLNPDQLVEQVQKHL